MDQANERERRQLALISERIQAFRSGRLSIGSVINDLEALLYELEEAPDTWKQAFTEEWSVLEIGYAVSLDRQQPQPDPTDPDISEALDRLETLARGRVDS